jgi:hypothetical protein
MALPGSARKHICLSVISALPPAPGRTLLSESRGPVCVFGGELVLPQAERLSFRGGRAAGECAEGQRRVRSRRPRRVMFPSGRFPPRKGSPVVARHAVCVGWPRASRAGVPRMCVCVAGGCARASCARPVLRAPSRIPVFDLKSGEATR